MEAKELIRKIRQEVKGTSLPSAEKKTLLSAVLYALSFEGSSEKELSSLLSSEGFDSLIAAVIRESFTDDSWKGFIDALGPVPFETVEEAILLYGEEQIKDETPEAVIALCASLLSDGTDSGILEVGSGSGTLLRELESTGHFNRERYTGIEIDMFRTVWSKAALGRGSRIINGDAFRLAVEDPSVRAGRVFSNYPMGVKLNEKRNVAALSSRLGMDPGQAVSSDWSFNILIASLMKEGGKAVGIMTQGSAINGSDRKAREAFAEKGLIEMVIDLPERVFRETAVRTSLIIFSEGNSSVKLIDAHTMSRKTLRGMEPDNDRILSLVRKASDAESDEFIATVTLEELRKKDYVLSRERYFDEEGFSRMEDLILSASRGTSMKEKDLEALFTHEDTGLKLLLPSDIRDGGIDWSSLHSLREIPGTEMKYTARSGDLIVTRTVSPLKAVTAEVPEGCSLLVSGSLFIVRLDGEKAEPHFAELYLKSRKGQEAVGRVATGTGVKLLSRTSLDQISFPSLPLAEQRERVERIRETEERIGKLLSEVEELRREEQKLIFEM